MRGLQGWIAVAATACVVGCANGSNGLTSPSQVAVGSTESVPSSCAVPGVPGSLSALVSGKGVSVTWSPVGDAVDYVLLVGRTPSSSDTLLTNTPDPSHWMDEVASGTHYVRVHAHNWCGTSQASTPVAFHVN
jgi:hypothetical protein